MAYSAPRYESALFRAAKEGSAKLCAAFGGQGPSNLACLKDLIELNKTYGSVLNELIHIASNTLSDLASIPHQSGFHEEQGFELQDWLVDPESAPGPEQLVLAPISFPLNTLLSLAHYAITCRSLGKDPGEVKASLNSVIGHSQGLFAAVAIARSNDWESFYESCILALRISFWVGLESHWAAPRSKISATAITDCIDHDEGQPSSMLSISGLSRSEIVRLVEKVNQTFIDEADAVDLALANSRDKFVLAGPAHSLRAVCIHLRQIKADDNLDQTRILFHKRKPHIDVHFLPISAPFHSSHLDKVDIDVCEALSSISLKGSQLGIPLYYTRDGRNFQEWQSEDILKPLVRAVTVDMVDWPDICKKLGATHMLDFGPGQIGSLVNESTEGTGLRIIQMTDRTSSSRSIGMRTEVFSADMPPYSPNWKQMFAPRLVKGRNGEVQLRTRMTDVFGAPPIMVAGMTPTTVPWDFVATVMNAGYHIELAGGGYSQKKRFEAAIRRLASTIPPNRGITCNLLYANPTTIAWQTSLLRDLVHEGVPIDGITIGAGIPSSEVVKEYIESIGLKHISFKPGSYDAITQVIEIAQQYPDFPIGLQWTGGRAGGHHSFEDFHGPILKTYARIRRCSNIVLVAGSGFGGSSDTVQYLTGDWSCQFDYPPMPFDGILLGSRMMVAKEAHTSIQAKQLIVEAEGAIDLQWHESYDKPTGGVITVTSEMGQPIHVIANRGMMLWKEFDQQIFSIKDRTQRLNYLHSHREEIISRLNKDFARPWFAVNHFGQGVDLEDLTYAEVLRRLCQLTYVQHQHRWIDPSWRTLVHDFCKLALERFGRRSDTSLEQPKPIISAFEETLGSDADEIVYPEDVALLMALFRRRGQKPVPFIPTLDENFETWFKKDSLWQSEDVDAVVDQDVQRVCVIHGPLAARYSTTAEESAKTILDKICQQYAQTLQCSKDSPSYPEQHLEQEEADLSAFSAVKVTGDQWTRKYELLRGGELPGKDMLIDHMIGQRPSWARASLSHPWVYRGNSRVENPICAAFEPTAGDAVEVKTMQDGTLQEITFRSGRPYEKSNPRSIFCIALESNAVKVKLTPPDPLNTKRASLEFVFDIKHDAQGLQLHERTTGLIERIKGLYSQLWTGKPTSLLPIAGLSSEFSGQDTVLSKRMIQDYMNVVGRSCPPNLQSWGPQGCVPLDYCIVLAWTALAKPLMIPAVDCDLLRLLHRSIRFKYADSVRPLEYDDVVRTVSRITSLTIQPTGKLIEVTADIRRRGETVMTVQSDFFIQGNFSDFEKQFKSVEEPEMIVNVDSEVLQALLLSRRWFILEGQPADLMGKSLSFRLTSHTMFNHEGEIGLLQVSGTVGIAGHDDSSSRQGRVYFEEDSCIGNPVMDFLRRHGSQRHERQALESPGWTEGSTIHLKAPSQSAPYAKVSLDTNPIHVCPLFARYAGLPGTVVHGMHTSAMIRRAVEWALGDTDRSRFKGWSVGFEGMVRPNDPMRIEFQHVAMEGGRMILKVQAFNDESGDKVVEAEAEVEQQRTVYAFCGQGSQEKGMGMSLYATSQQAKALWDRGDSFLREHYGFSLLHIVRDNPQTLKISFGGKRGRRVRANYLAMTKDEPILKGLTPRSTSYTFFYPKGLLMSTQFSQPALALMEMVEYEHLKAIGVVQSGALFAGHSLGEYAALGACSTFMSFENLLTLIFYRGLKMQNALQRDAKGRTNYSMVAADPSRVGKAFDQRAFQNLVTLIAQEMKLLLEVVNHNVESQQYVCAGHLHSLFVLGKVCDELSKHPKPHLLDTPSLQDIIRRHMQAAEHLPDHPTLERGKATIPLSGIDIPFHSTLLRSHIPDYREYLSSKLHVSDVKPEELEGRWIPNVVGKPFSTEKAYVELVQEVTGSESLARLLRGMGN